LGELSKENVEALKRAAETRDPIIKDGAELMTLQALALRGLEQRGDALALLAQAAEDEPFEAWTQRNYAIALLEGGQYGQASERLAAILRLQPTDIQAKLLIDVALSLKTPAPGSGSMGFDLEFPHLNKTIYRYSFYQDPKELAVQVNFASMELIRAGESGSAISFLERFLEVYAMSPTADAPSSAKAPGSDPLKVDVQVRVHPVSVPAYLNLAKLYGGSGRGKRAIECLELALKLAPQNADTHFELGRLLRSAARPRLPSNTLKDL